MGRSKSTKRRLRRLQKLKKRNRFRHTLASESSSTRPADEMSESTHDPELTRTPSDLSSDDDSFGSPGSLPPSPVPSEPDPPSLDTVHVHRQGIKDQCTIRTLEEKLYQSGQKVNYYRNEVKQQEDKYIRTLHRKEKDCTQRVRYVTHFWCEKIYRERTRSGKILKAAMQGRTINE